MRRESRRSWPGELVVPALAAAVAVCASASAEVPSWQEIAGRLYVIRHGYWDSSGERSFGGLWAYEPDTDAYTWLAPFRFNNRTPLYHTGQGAFLAGGDGRLVMQAWPYSLDFDLESLRLLRRYPPIEDPAAFGWTVQGALVSQELASVWDVEPGFYGFPLCLLGPLSVVWDSPSYTRVCEAYFFPSLDMPIKGSGGDTSVLLRRALGPGDGHLYAAGYVDRFLWSYGASGENSVSRPPVLSVDPEGGLWRGIPRGVQLLPFEDGGIGPASRIELFAFPPFDRPDAQLESLFFHPGRRRFYGTARFLESIWGELWQFELNDDLDLVSSFDMSPLSEGAPVTFAWAGERPAVREQLVPIIAHSEGRNGTFWTSDLWLYNPSAQPTSVRLERLSPPAVARTVSLPPHGSQHITDALAWLGGGPQGDGSRHDALLLEAPYHWGEQVVAVSRAHTPHEEGSYGQAVPAVPGRVGYSNHLHDPGGPFFDTHYNIWEQGMRVSNLTPDERHPGRFRHNLGVVNTGDTPLQLTLVWGFAVHWEDSELPDMRPPAATQYVTVGPRQVRLVNLETLFPPEVHEVWPARVAVFGERPAAVWLSMVDNLTGDATFVPFTNFHWATDTDANRAVVPVVAHGPGVDDALWRTDVYGIQGNFVYRCGHPGDYDSPRAWLHPAEPATHCGGAAAEGEISTYLEGELGVPLQAWFDELTGDGEPPPLSDAIFCWRTVFPDVVHLFAECAQDEDVRGALEISSNGWTSGYSRTYTTRPDGGTYGEMLPFYPVGGWPVQHFAGVEVAPASRVNVGLFNGDHEHAITHRLTLYADDGEQVAQQTLTLAPLASYQRRLEHVFGLQLGDLPAGTYGLTVLPLDDDENGIQGRSWAYVSLVDNATGDPTNWW